MEHKNCCDHAEENLKSLKDKNGSENTIYICPMHPEERKTGQGKCSVCGMDLIPEEKI